jgi:hypothetical protein
VLPGARSSCVASDGSLAIVHGEFTRPEADSRVASACWRGIATTRSLRRLEGSYVVADLGTPRTRRSCSRTIGSACGTSTIHVSDGVVCFAPS